MDEKKVTETVTEHYDNAGQVKKVTKKTTKSPTQKDIIKKISALELKISNLEN